MREYAILAIVALASAILVLNFAYAVPQDGQASLGATGYSTVTAANSVTTNGSNVTNVNVSSAQTTTNWQGFWGNVSGSLILGDGANTLYDWSGVQFRAVFASPGNDIDWSNTANLTTQASLEGKDTDFGFASSANDSINQTFTGNTCSAGDALSAAAGVTTLNSSSEASAFETCIGEDTGADVTDTVFGVSIVNAGSNGFNGDLVQYQMMVPVNASGQLYYFYLEV